MNKYITIAVLTIISFVSCKNDVSEIIRKAEMGD